MQWVPHRRRRFQRGCVLSTLTMLALAGALPGCDTKQDGSIPSSEYRGGPLDAVRAANPTEDAVAAASSPPAASAPAAK